MVVNVRRQTLKDINNSMKGTSHTSSNPFKIIKMVNGDDVICKIAEEYKDALVIEYPMSIVKNQVVENENSIVEHTGLQRWMNYTQDTIFVIPKEKILSFIFSIASTSLDGSLLVSNSNLLHTCL